jgi:D-serine deaminase-like pyridoxal phosphate-dependent protein
MSSPTLSTFQPEGTAPAPPQVGADLSTLATPALVLDASTMEANLRRMRERAARLGVRLRPHVKTAKCREIARLLTGDYAEPITVSTLREAAFFAADGAQDILYAVGIAPNKLDQVLTLLRLGVDLKLIVDSVPMAGRLAAFARAAGVRLSVLIEIDCDGHRSGVAPEAPLLLEVAAALAAGGLKGGGTELAGVMTHAGASYDSETPEEIRGSAERERWSVTRAAERLRAAGHPLSIVSVGSTPTALSATELAGVTEIRAGVYTFFDLVMHDLGVCRLDEIALSVLTTVIGHQEAKEWAIVDAGWMALSRDRGRVRPGAEPVYGRICDVEGQPLGDLVVAAVNQEHGIVVSPGGFPVSPETLPVGMPLRILPNHACATAAQHDEYLVVRGGDRVEEVWSRIRGW